ncbi:MAG TPA: hypothetical protein VF618_11750 [Thermoanaerobaculia bacterium]
MAKRKDDTDRRGGNVVAGTFRPDLRARIPVEIELPAFLVCALEARVAEANADGDLDERCTLNDYIETELVNLVTLRDVAELDLHVPGFAEAVYEWITEMRE